MKRILFLIPNLMHGGAEKVLVNLLNNLDNTKYHITLFSIFDCGVNKGDLNPAIRYQYKFKKIFRGNSQIFKLFSPEFLYHWLIKEDYDIAIAYLEGPASRIVSGCPDTKTRKIAWIHTTLNDSQLIKVGFRSLREAVVYYRKFDKIIGVSKEVVDSVTRNISNMMTTDVIYNVNETDQILQHSNEVVSEITFDKSLINICSVGKIVPVKGFDRLLEVHKRLLDEGYKHKVNIIGIGEEQKSIVRRAKELGVEESFKFIGFHKNPYKFVSKCDLYVCSSRREGFSTAVTEALVLGIPVVSTNCSGATELLGENNEYGLVVENSTEGLYQGMKTMLSNPENLSHYKKQAEIRGSFFSKENTVKAVENMLDSF